MPGKPDQSKSVHTEPVANAPSPGACSPQGRSLLALTMVPGLGPIRIASLIEAMGSPQQVVHASAARLGQIRGIGSRTATSIAEHLHVAHKRVNEELEKIANAGAHVVSIADPHYPPMLAGIPSAPPILMIRGQFDHAKTNRYTVAIVGSRACSVYGSEQARRFGGGLASAGLTVISGGARGIDTAAHRGVLEAQGKTAVVLGCGIGKVYPPENAELFDDIVAQGGAIISELPVGAAPDAKNFPARNRIISGLSLGVVVMEAGLKSGALITARHAIEDHGREVMGVPGRVDSQASRGTHELLRDGAHLVIEPNDVLSILERDAFHLHGGTHRAKTGGLTPQPMNQNRIQTRNPVPSLTDAQPPTPTSSGDRANEKRGLLDDWTDLDAESRAIMGALETPRTGDELADALGTAPGSLRAKLTMLEIQGRVRRAGSRFERVR